MHKIGDEIHIFLSSGNKPRRYKFKNADKVLSEIEDAIKTNKPITLEADE